MLMIALDTAAYVILLLLVVLLFGLVVAFFVPTATHPARLGLPAVGLYVVLELAALVLALALVNSIGGYEVLPTLIAAVLLALILVPGLAAKLPKLPIPKMPGSSN
jgi:hypothetical protein